MFITHDTDFENLPHLGLLFLRDLFQKIRHKTRKKEEEGVCNGVLMLVEW